MDPAAAAQRKRQCPECRVTLTRYEWSKLWWMSSVMSGHLVQPCAECGARLRLSSMALVSSIAALALIGAAISYAVYQTPVLLLVSLALLLVLLIAMVATRVETVPSVLAQIDPKPERIGKKRL